jgi:hypothetical protein
MVFELTKSKMSNNECHTTRVGSKRCRIFYLMGNYADTLRPARGWEILNCRLVNQQYKMHYNTKMLAFSDFYVNQSLAGQTIPQNYTM